MRPSCSTSFEPPGGSSSRVAIFTNPGMPSPLDGRVPAADSLPEKC